MRVPSVLRDLANFCYPGCCAVCETAYEGSLPLCGECDAALRKVADEPSCGFCAMPLPVHNSPCPYCEGNGVAHFERIIRLGSFHDPLKRLIHQIKYHNRWPLAEFLADRLMELERVKAILQEGGVLLPVPLHPMRQIARGFNQADVIARRLRWRDGSLRIVNPVLRLRHTETQTQLHSHAQRAENLRDAFGLIRPSSVRGRHVIVIDDVRTTGATMHALARALRPAKPASLCAIVLAVADPKGKDFEAV